VAEKHQRTSEAGDLPDSVDESSALRVGSTPKEHRATRARRTQDPWLVTKVDKILISNLWLRTLILGSASILLMLYGLNHQIANTRHITAVDYVAYIATQLSPALLVAVVGAAIVQWVIMRDPDTHKAIHEKIELESLNSWHKQYDGKLDHSTEALNSNMAEIRGELSSIQDLLGRTHNRAEAADALERVGFISAYASQEAAVEDMTRTLRQDDLAEVRLLGLSLNSWFAGHRRDLGAVLEGMLLNNSDTRKPPISAKIMLIDPYSAAARFLMSGPENQTRRERAARLRDEVRATAGHLIGIRNQLRAQHSGSRLDIRLYRFLPGLYSFTSNHGTFLRAYHAVPSQWWPNAQVWRYGPNSNLHTSTRSHFDLLWDLHAIEPESILSERSYGVDQGVAESGMQNIFTDEERASARMAWLIEHAQERVWIQGISLAPMFRPRLEKAMHDLFVRSHVDTRLLILDPDCEQAYYKSYRDYLLNRKSGEPLEYERYRSDGRLHTSSALYSNIRYSTEQVRSFTTHSTAANLKLRYYDCAANSFMLIADDIAMVEQYHYGKQPHARHGMLQLTQEMPLVEFHRPNSELFQPNADVDPIAVMEDSFTFIFDRLSRPFSD
jgi:hypothetical protein